MTRKLSPSAYLSLDAILDEGELLFASGIDGYVYVLETGTTDDGDDITTQWETGWIDMGEPEMDKMFAFIYVDLESLKGPITIDWIVDGGRSEGQELAQFPPKDQIVWDSANEVWDSTTKVWKIVEPSSIRKKRLVLALSQKAEGRKIKFTFSSTQDFQISGFGVMYRSKDSVAPQGGI